MKCSIQNLRAIMWLLVLAASVWTCAGQKRASQPDDDQLLLSQKVQNWLQNAIQSVVGVAGVFDYRTETYHHELVNGRWVPDASSPTGYRLQRLPSGKNIERKQESHKVIGAGLIIYRDERRALILTSAHILIKPDTINSFYRDDNGRVTDMLSSRSFKVGASFHIIGQSNQFLPAEVMHTDSRADLGLVLVTAAPALGIVFPYHFAYSRPATWGDVAYVVGFPREVKQLSSGLVSEVPHSGSFILDTVARYGFSGGPVLVIRPGRGLELAGIIRGVPVNKLFYVAPPENALPGSPLVPHDLEALSAQEVDLIDYGTAYAVSIDAIGRFLKAKSKELEAKRIFLNAKYLPD